jgi:sugar lactone lactonase YvrE
MNLTVSGITFPVGFSVNWSGTIAAGTSQNIAVTFAPIGVENYSENITVSSDATSGSVSIPTSGTGVATLVTVSTLAGSGTVGYADGQGSSASFKWIGGVAVDRSGNVYVADTLNHRIRKVTANGAVSTLAGSGMEAYADGQGTSASFYRPKGVAVDVSGNVYVADAANTRIRKITASGNVTTLAGGSYGYADGQGTSAGFNWPVGVAVDRSGNVYVADSLGHRIRKITQSGNVATLAGSGSVGDADGQGSSASFNNPGGVAVDGDGTVYVADSDNNRVRKIAPNGMVATLAGSGTAGYADGQGGSASFNRPLGVAVDGSGNVYVADANNNRIRKITANGTVSTLAGGDSGYADGAGSSAKFYYPIGIAVDENGNLYVADYGDSRIRKITISQYHSR